MLATIYKELLKGVNLTLPITLQIVDGKWFWYHLWCSAKRNMIQGLVAYGTAPLFHKRVDGTEDSIHGGTGENSHVVQGNL